MEIQIEELKKQHHKEVKDLLVELQKYIVEIDKFNLNILSSDYRERYFKYMLDDCKKNEGKVFVCTSENKVVGMIAGYIEKYSKRDKLDYSCPKKGIVAELIVNKNSRKLGIGKLLLEKMEEYFKSINCQYVQIDVFAYNENAKQFYYNNCYEDRMVTVFKRLEK